MRRLVLLLLLIVAPAMAQRTAAEPWAKADPASAGWSGEVLQAVGAYVEKAAPSALMIVQHGKVVASWGDVTRKSNVASVRKSLIGALYGIAVAEGRINLGRSLADLGLDDNAPSLSEEEKQASVADLLKSRSGVYHIATMETDDMRRTRPMRGSHAAGTFFFYNNWDFNALGTIYRQLTSEDIFESFGRRIATPIGMEDFTPADGRYVTNQLSLHPAYMFRLSARDAARFGQLFLNGGRWNGAQIVPAAWVSESLTAHSVTDYGPFGYGYLWWTLDPQTFGPGAAAALGYGGQVIAIIPAKGLVVVQLADPWLNARGIRISRFMPVLRRIAAAAP